MPDLIKKMGNLEQVLGTMQSRIEQLGRVAIAVPYRRYGTDFRLTDHKEHTFREYKSTRGLTKPYQTTGDFIFGRRWVDLSEPED